jgi:Ca2+-binding RTX toxin-like protein
MQGPFACTGRIVVYGDDNDLEWISPAITRSAWLYGGSGTDYLYGGGGNDVIVGGPGTNFIYGGAGRNLLIGGGGGGRPNFIFGTTGDNIEISGTTDYDANQAALNAILQEWGSGDSYSARVQKITQTGLSVNGSTVKLNSSTIQRVAAYEYLFGGTGQNLYFATQTGSTFDRDYVIGRKSNETVLPS